jgi:hypothetical protein
MIGHIHKSGLMKRSAPLICVVNYSSNAGGRPADNNDRGKIRHARIAKPFSRPLSPVGAPAQPGWRARSARLARPLSPASLTVRQGPDSRLRRPGQPGEAGRPAAGSLRVPSGSVRAAHCRRQGARPAVGSVN